MPFYHGAEPGIGNSLEAAAVGEPDAPCPEASVAVLLCTFNGDKFLEEQLESIGRQQGVRVHVYVSDDGSRDNTPEILERYRARWGEGRLSIAQGPGLGHVANFFSLICTTIDADYFAYADQDDIWDPDKLSRAIAALSSMPEGQATLYCSRTRVVSQGGLPLGLSPLFRKSPGFANALIHNIGGGNTMVLNRTGRELLRAVGPVDIVSHDWWTYLLVTASGGAVVYDPHPSLRYRQHQDNLIGSNMSWGERLARFALALRGRNREWNTRNIRALRYASNSLTAENKKILDEFSHARDARLIPRLLGVWRSGVYAQSGWGNLTLIAATFLKKL